MSEKIVQLNEEVIKGQIKELVCGSVEERHGVQAVYASRDGACSGRMDAAELCVQPLEASS